MKLGTQLKKLHKKIKAEKKYKTKLPEDVLGGDIHIDSKKMKSEEDKIEKTIEKLDLLKRLLKMINEGATGFDLAYEVERNQEVKSLLYNGILFYNAFLEIGNKKFIEAPDKIKVNYKSFKTIEETEKYIFMIWLKETINSIEKEVQSNEDYAKYIEAIEAQEIKETIERLRKKLTHCKNCGARIQSEVQEFCEKCGINLLESILEK